MNNKELPPISKQQQIIISHIANNNNVIVESVAGSGKTTSNIYIAKSFPTSSILLLTYNAKLKMETRDKVYQLGINNIETHSYHSFCVKYYNNKCYTDYQIIDIIKNNLSKLKNFKYDIIILDEAQDISPLYHQLICKIFSDNQKDGFPIICLLGDRYQSIYDFNKADPRFIIYADQLFKFNNLNWEKCQLSQSYRITHEMAEFINECMISDTRITSTKISKIKPKYIITDVYSESKNAKAFIEIKNILKKYRPEEVFILAPSVKSEKTPVRQLENLIKTNLSNIPVYVPVSDEEKLDNDILKNKLVFSTFHQAKGLERKAILIFNFDDSYFKFYKKEKDPNICPNELYVATTRALEYLVVIHHIKNDYLPFLNKHKLDKYCDVITNGIIQPQKVKNKTSQEVSITDLIKHLPIEVLNNCMSYLDIKNINLASSIISIPIKIEQSHGFESVSEITGTAIPAYFQLLSTKRMSIYNEALQHYRKEGIETKSQSNNCDFIDSDEDDKKVEIQKYNLENINLNKIKPDEILYIANYYCSKKSGFLYKIYQINNYDWLSQENLNKVIKRMQLLDISNKAIYEQYYEIDNLPELHNKRLVGFVDCLDTNRLFEFKCVNKLENEHYLQLALYMYLHQTAQKSNPKIKSTILPSVKESIIKDLLDYIEKNNIKIEKTKDIYSLNQLIELNQKLNSKVSEILGTQSKSENNMTYYLYNILTDQLDQISCDYDKLKHMVEYLIKSKYFGSKEIPDEIFIKNILDNKNKYYNKEIVV
jgi:hypothetical protein